MIEADLRLAGVSGVSAELVSRLAKQLGHDEKILAGSTYEVASGPFLVNFGGKDVSAGTVIATDKRLLLFPRASDEVHQARWRGSVDAVPARNARTLLRFSDVAYPLMVGGWGFIVMEDAQQARKLMDVVNAEVRAAPG
jgi:hypothetical protein